MTRLILFFLLGVLLGGLAVILAEKRVGEPTRSLKTGNGYSLYYRQPPMPMEEIDDVPNN